MAFQQVDDPTPGKNRVHIDFSTADMEAEVKRLVDLGASETGRDSFGDDSSGWCSPIPTATRSVWRGSSRYLIRWATPATSCQNAAVGSPN